jgi:hypothetical protein
MTATSRWSTRGSSELPLGARKTTARQLHVWLLVTGLDRRVEATAGAMPVAVSAVAGRAGCSQGAVGGGELAVQEPPLFAERLVFVFQVADSGQQ